jgi:putative spermidine/putrescine transport system ATP-binding protein
VHVRFAGVQKSYDGEALVVKNLDLDIFAGEFLTMLGPSGSGKTTCLMMLAGFESLTRGEIYVGGKPVAKVPPHKRGVGMVFQNYALFPHMTVFENLAFPLEVRRIGKDDVRAKVKRALAMVRLEEFGVRRPGQLSGGQQQRVAVARALVFEPSLVLMDEPLGALDKNLREQMQYELKEIHENLNVTVVYVTHDQSEALTMSNRIAVFNDGVIQQLATPDDLYEKPQNAFVAGFIGENNKLFGAVEKSADENLICEVRADGGETVRALAVAVKQGERTCMSLRPERVEINPGGPIAERMNIFPATIAELIYHGDHIRVRVDLFGRDNFIVKIPNHSANSRRGAARANLRAGANITVGWFPQDCRALDMPA